jgi:hypothetical protein
MMLKDWDARNLRKEKLPMPDLCRTQIIGQSCVSDTIVGFETEIKCPDIFQHVPRPTVRVLCKKIEEISMNMFVLVKRGKCDFLFKNFSF